METFIFSCCQIFLVFKQTRKIKVDPKNYLDFIIFAINMYVLEFGANSLSISLPPNVMVERIDILEKTMIIFIFLMWVKLLLYLKVFKTFGAIIKIIELMIKDILNFIIIFMINVSAFATTFYIFFD